MLQKAFALHQKAQLAEAAALYREVLSLDPENADALHLLAVVEVQRRNPSAAIELFERAIELNPNNAAYLSNRGAALRELKRLDEALASFDRALAIQPDYAEALNNRGLVLQELKCLDEALASLDRALVTRPDYLEALTNRGIVLRDLKRLDEALTSLSRAVAIGPHCAEALNALGTVLQDLKRIDEALAIYDRAVAVRPDYVEAHTNRGVVLRELKRYDEALASYDRALAFNPDHADARFYRALAQLACGDFRNGFAGYEWRWETKDFPSKAPRSAAPKWLGEDLNGRSILVFSEQGLGDTIQFARYLPLLIQLGARVTFLCPAKLHRLLRPFGEQVEFVAALAENEAFDFQCALMSMPLRFGTDWESIPNCVPYLEAETDLAGRWKQRVGEGGFKIGIAWHGNANLRIGNEKSVPLSEFIPIARRPGVRLISLQKHQGLDQLQSLTDMITVETLGDGFDRGPDAFIDTAAVMSNLDLIVTIDTSIAHLAGALARPTWVALPEVPEWRWLRDRNDSPWYPTIRLFRQQTRDDWRIVFQDIAVELDSVLFRHQRA